MIRQGRVKHLSTWGLILFGLSLWLLPTGSQAAVPTLSTDELHARLGSPDVVIVDIRLGKDWKASESKIKGAIRVEASAVDTLASTYDKDKTLVFYCA